MTPPTDLRVDYDAVSRDIIDLLRAEVDVPGLTAESDLLSNAFDSLKVMSLLFKIEVRYDIHLEEEDADDLRTVGDLASLVIRRTEQSR